MSVDLTRDPRRDLVVKRAFDLSVAALGLVVTAPLLAAIAVAIKLDDFGPVIFSQERVGQHGVPFRIHKFRSMRVQEGGALISATTDPRITRIGAVLRRSKLDELPQLANVLAGTMSLVGPRPEVPRYVALWPADAREAILSVRPGITDPASIAFRNESEELARVEDPEAHYVDVVLPRKAQMYLKYARSRTFTEDLRIILATFRSLAR